jgi:type I restriction enzyme S subunit
MTSIGDWSISKLDDITDRGSGHTPSQSRPDYWDGEVDWVSLADSSNLDRGLLASTSRRISHLGLAGSSAVLHAAGTVIMSRDAGVGKCAILERDMAVSQHFIAWNCENKGVLEPWFLYYWLQARKKYFERMAVGSTIKTIGLPLFKSMSVAYPSLPNQRRITDILRTWDEAIDGTTRIHRSKSAQLDRLRASVFDTRVGLASGWPTSPLRSIADRVISKSAGELHPVMAISAKSGFELQSTKYSRDMAGANLANYTLLRRGEFAYNKGNSLTYPQGCIYQLKEDSALVPNVYFSFKLDENLNSTFFGHYFAAGGLNRQLAHRISSGVRGNGLLNLNPEDFFDVEVPVPDLPIQDSVANLLGTASRELALLDLELKLLNTQKSGLMQMLLTGEVQVTSDMEDYS